MHLLKIVILGLLSYATSEIFMSGGFGMKDLPICELWL